MKNFIKLLTLVLVVLVALPDDAVAQRKKNSKKSDFDLKEKLWYGGGFGLGFGGSQFESQFFVGVSPMVGYKITPWLSAGPRLDFNYVLYRVQFTQSVESYNIFSYGIGPFLRAKTNFKLFGHFEYQINLVDVPDGINYIYNKEAAYIGLGYNDSGSRNIWGYEIYVVYDVLAPQNTVRLPIDIRFGLTYNF
ncbi:MAG: hypothetical protein KDC24_14760 [Saprospiraceae bacterium]|nr:hypothetical protein [Saprospiraceae bacterium]